MTAEPLQRWEPDEQLVPSVLASPKASKRMQDLPGPDRCWLVAGLTVHGLTAKDIADRTGCSIRLVKSIRAEDMTQVCVVALRETKAFDAELRLVRSELAVKDREQAETEAELGRVRLQLDRMIDAQITGGAVPVCSAGHAMTPYNTYIQKSTGKRFCRECHRDRQKRYRQAGKRASSTGSSTSSTICVAPVAITVPAHE